MTPDLHDADRRILRLLQHDARISNQDLADKAGLSPSACWRRVRAMEESGLIRRHVALVEPELAGLSFSAIVHVTLTRHDSGHVETFISRVRDRAEVLECFATTGEADYHLLVLCPDKEAYNNFLEGFLFRLPGIAHVRTNMVLKVIKSETAVPV
jgi:DNA-binding Lrp family transcriptional regulator